MLVMMGTSTVIFGVPFFKIWSISEFSSMSYIFVSNKTTTDKQQFSFFVNPQVLFECMGFLGIIVYIIVSLYGPHSNHD